ncbi:peroxiredoxin [Haloactinopolyspora alba]|uniref:Peroxiredoxin n=1 Tax=Haloactinopolyspora alba TaxID=648780 RepID=A0A2P8DGN0_9ACTN|nr:TlpA disulfide reductase family protein [Haloactinopolyspora alba]PSK96384.1 peroxiredoxin [Haloactinopolyspora alba]
MMRHARLVAVVVAAAALFAGCSDGQVQRDGDSDRSGYIEGDGAVSTYPPAEREPAPDFSGPLLDGDDTFELADAAGDVVVLNVWGSWCPPCRKEAPGLQAVHEALRDQGVRFVGVNTRDDETAANAFEDEFGITYPSVFDPKGEALLAFRKTVPPGAIPSTLVIDRQGRIAARVLGAISETSLRQLVADIAAEDPTAS